MRESTFTPLTPLGQAWLVRMAAKEEAYSGLLRAAKLSLALLEDEQSSIGARNFCEFCLEEAPRVEDTYVADVIHRPDCAYDQLKQAIAAMEGK